MRDRWCWIDGCIVLVLVAAALLGGWGARGWVEGYKAWLDTPIVTIEREGPRDVAVCVSADLPTLWHIAREYYPDKHTGMMVEEIRKANPDLDPGRLQIGQVVVLP
jgi:hypothetical protein